MFSLALSSSIPTSSFSGVLRVHRSRRNTAGIRGQTKPLPWSSAALPFTATSEVIRVVSGSRAFRACDGLASGAPGVVSLRRETPGLTIRANVLSASLTRMGIGHGLNFRRPTSRTARLTSRETTPATTACARAHDWKPGGEVEANTAQAKFFGTEWDKSKVCDAWK
jgi:hypothetical protein